MLNMSTVCHVRPDSTVMFYTSEHQGVYYYISVYY